MKKLLLLILFPLLLQAQHFTETFDSFIPDTTTGQSTYIFDPQFGALTADKTGAATLTANGGIGDSLLTYSLIKNGGKSVYFDNVDDWYTVTRTLPDSGTLISYYNSLDASNDRIWSYSDGSSNRNYILLGDGASNNIYLGLYNISTILQTGIAAGTNKWSIMVLKWKSGKYTIRNYRTDIGSLQISSGTYTQGTYLSATFGIGTTSIFNGYQTLLKITSDTLSLKAMNEDLFLADGWVSKQGEVIRQNFSAFAQGINGSGLAVKVGSGAYVSQSLTASSVTYSLNLGAVNLSSDSVFVATNTDTLSHALADSTLPDGYQWTLSIDAQETGGVVYVDNLSLTTSLIPTDTETQDKGFKEHSKFKRFKSLK